MSNVVSIQARRSAARSRAGAEQSVSGRRNSGTFLGQRMVAAIPVQAIDHLALAQWEKSVRRTTLATVTTAFLFAAAFGAFGLSGLL